ncbi:hypothetical protein AB0I82_35900 [Streptomyces sp. NPDC050315]|uniref:hypothetical protein n=1 Tax=Streptomyces sp. NPDC050315 TaxID=3155039 RepID=UPI0034479191
MSAAGEAEPLIGRCYTRARRHPLVIGNWPGGGRIWGGPYTVPQVVVMAVTFTLLLLTRSLWAHLGLLDVLPLLGVPYGLALAMRRVHIDGRNPFAVASSASGLALAAPAGRLDGKPVRTRRPQVAIGVCTVTSRPTAPAQEQPSAAGAAGAAAIIAAHRPGGPYEAEPESAPEQAVPQAGPGRVASGAGALLARTAAAHDSGIKGR